MNDLKFAVRQLLKNPGFTAVAVLTLALGIGANTAIFTLLSKALIRPLPVEEPNQLVAFIDGGKGQGRFSYPFYLELSERTNVLSGVVAYAQRPFHLSKDGKSDRLVGQFVSGNYFAVLGVRPALGRFFLPEEDRAPVANPAVVLSHGLWRRRFGADPSVIGSTVLLNGHSGVVIGVAPAEFTGTTRGTVTDVYAPIGMQPAQLLRNANSGWLHLLGRIPPTLSREQAQAGLAVAADDAPKISLTDGSHGHTGRITDLSLPLKLLMGVVGFILVIVVANVANLLLTRATGRRREVAIRMAIGATRGRILRQMFVESALLAVLGGVAGLLVADLCTRLLLSIQGPTASIPRALDGSLDGGMLCFALGLALLTGIAFGLAPALQSSKLDFVSALKAETAGLGGRGRRRLTLRGLFVVVQVALSIVVLIGAGLCVSSLRALNAIDPGMELAKVMTASFDLGLSGYDETRGRQFLQRLGERVEALPGVESAGFATIVAFSESVWVMGATIDGQGPKEFGFDFNAVSPNYFRTIGARLVQGREFTRQDTPTDQRVIVVNEATANRYWPGEDAIGKKTSLGDVVGVVRDTREKGLTKASGPTIYLPLAQHHAAGLTLHVRAALDTRSIASAIRREVQAIDPTLPLYNLQTLAAQKDGSLYKERVVATLLALFAALALVLAMIGLYGVLSCLVTNTQREIGIRMAIGAQRHDVISHILGQGMSLTMIGVVIGVGAALLLTQLLQKLLYGVSPTDPLTFAVIPLLLVGVALVACWLPARRAARIDPMEALRCE